MSMRTIHSLAGKAFGRLAVDSEAGRDKSQLVLWNCHCSCGNKVIVAGTMLKRGRVKSCGCLTRDVGQKNKLIATKHGYANSKIYRVWQSMLQRCENKKSISWKNYGSRGISVCSDWHDPAKFIQWALRNGYSDNLTIERINNDGNYEPANCRWATYQEQINNRRTTFFVVFSGVKIPIAVLARKVGLPIDTLRYHILISGWGFERAVQG